MNYQAQFIEMASHIWQKSRVHVLIKFAGVIFYVYLLGMWSFHSSLWLQLTCELKLQQSQTSPA